MAQVLICNTKIGPYHAARIRALAQVVPGVMAVQAAANEAQYPWWRHSDGVGIPCVTLCPEGSFESIPIHRQITALEKLLAAEQPAAVVVDGYSEPLMQTAARWARRHGRLSVMLFISWAGDRRRFPPREWLKRLLLRRLCDAVCVGGERQYAYARRLGVDESRLWRLYNVIDNAHFAEGTREALANSPALRDTHGLPEHYFLYVGRFEPWKNLRTLLAAYRRYRALGGAWDLVLVGCGGEEAALRQFVEQHRVPGVHWAGSKTYAELPACYALASCFVLPSLSEPWGLVVNEAMACGLPVLASTQCGCSPELVHRGVNGYAFHPTDVAGLARLMCRIAGGEVDLPAFAQASREIISGYTPERWARALADCLCQGSPAVKMIATTERRVITG